MRSERRITDFLEALACFMSSTAIDAGVPMLAELPARFDGVRTELHLVTDDRRVVARLSDGWSGGRGEALTELALVV